MADKIESYSTDECTLDQLKELKYAAELHLKFSDLYLPMLRGMSESYESEKNPSAWKTLKEGSYFLGNAYGLVKKYKECMPGPIGDMNMEIINAALITLQFLPEHISSGYTDEAYGGTAQCFVSKGQDTLYYELLHSELRKDVRLFIKLVERNIDAPVRRFLESITEKWQSILLEKLFKAIADKSCSEVENYIKEGADIHAKNRDGRTVLHYAVNIGNVGIIKMLLTSGADATQVTNRGNTPLHIAILKGHREIVETLLQHVKHSKLIDFINVQTTGEGTAALHVAATHGFMDILKSLLKHGATYNIQNNERKTPLDLCKDQNISILLKLIVELFDNVKDGNIEVIAKLRSVQPDEFAAITNTRNNEGNTLLQVAIFNHHKNIARELLKMLKNPNEIQSYSTPEFSFDQLKKLQHAAELHLEFSDMYLPKLRGMSESCGSEKNPSPWITLKEGSYFLGNAYNLVKKYKECMPGPIGDMNIEIINAALITLQFLPEHISSGYTDEAYGGTAQCFVSKGQDTLYYELLHSELKKDIRLFIKLVERNIDAPIRRFLASYKKRLQLNKYLKP